MNTTRLYGNARRQGTGKFARALGYNRGKAGAMQVRVLFFGMLRELLGRSSDSLALTDGATLGDVVAHYAQAAPQLKKFLPSLALSINSEYAAADERLADGDEVALLPPVSGGVDDDEETRRAADV